MSFGKRLPAGTTGFIHALVVCGGFTALFAWLLARPILDGNLLSESDLFDYYLPVFLTEPGIWSSFQWGGVPLFADPAQASVYALRVLFGAVGSWTGYIASAYVVAACGAYAYVFLHTRSRLAATVSGLTFALSEAMIERLPHPNIVHAAAWIPLLVTALDLVESGRNRRLWIAIGACAAALSMQAGHPQIPVYAAYVCGAYALASAFAARQPVRYVAAVGAMGVAAVMAASIVLLPSIEVSRHMVRGVVSFADFVSYSNTPAQMLSALLPTVAHGGLEAPTYVGVGVLMLAPLGLWRSRPDWRVRFWLIVAVVTMVLAVGDATPLARLVYELPLHDRFRIVARAALFGAFGFTVAAGFGVAALQARRVPGWVLVGALAVGLAAVVSGAITVAAWPDLFPLESVARTRGLPVWGTDIWMQLAISGAAAVVVAGFWWQPGGWLWAGLLVAALVGDSVHGLSYDVRAVGLDLQTVPRQAIAPSVHAVRLQAELEPNHQRLLPASGALRDDLVPGAFAMPWEIPVFGGYSDIALETMAQLAMTGGSGAVAPEVFSPQDVALDLLAVKYVSVRHDAARAVSDQLSRDPERWREIRTLSTSRTTDRVVDEEAPHESLYTVFENRRALPRVWLARELVSVTDGAIVDAVRGSMLPDGRRFVPGVMALVDDERIPSRVYPGDESGLDIESIADGAIAIRVSSSGGGFLVLSEAYYPGWRARVDDGGWQPVIKTDLALQGIEVPAGVHVVVFEFSSTVQLVGAAMSAVTMLLLALVVVAALWRASRVADGPRHAM